MGLDMYFEARKQQFKTFGRFSEAGKADETNYPEDLKVFADCIFERNCKSVEIIESFQVGYFRKFNALHNFIIDTFADGVDNQKPVMLNKVNIKKMLEVCKTVSDDHSKAQELLPTAMGNCFGPIDYDEDYFEDVEEAIHLFKLILDTIDFNKYELIYIASW